MADTVDAQRIHEYNEESTAEFHAKLDELTRLVQQSKYTVFFTGAGVSTAAGIGDYRGPSGAWTRQKIHSLERKKATGNISPEDAEELRVLLEEAAKEERKAPKRVPMTDAQPTATHMAQATLIRRGLGHFVVTTNLDGVYRKAGLVDHETITYLHGDIYIERCTRCGFDFERNYHVRRDELHVHDHLAGTCPKCGSAPPRNYKGTPNGAKMKNSRWGGVMVGTRDKDCGTKDTHINFGECLDTVDWEDAEKHCGRADLCIVAGTSMSLRHITHFPFMARRVVIINLQQTPDDDKADLRIWARCDPVFLGVLERLGLELDPIPVWQPRDALPLNQLPSWVDRDYRASAARLQKLTEQRLRQQLQTQTVPAQPSPRADPHPLRTRLAELTAAGLQIGNKHEKVGGGGGRGDCKHKWAMYVVPIAEGAALGEVVECVEYALHPTFSPPAVKVAQPPYLLERLGWGTFEVGVTIHWKAETGHAPSHYTHELSFATTDSSRTVHVA